MSIYNIHLTRPTYNAYLLFVRFVEAFIYYYACRLRGAGGVWVSRAFRVYIALGAPPPRSHQSHSSSPALY